MLFAVAITIGIFHQQTSRLSDVALANIEALCSPEVPVKVPCKKEDRAQCEFIEVVLDIEGNVALEIPSVEYDYIAVSSKN